MSNALKLNILADYIEKHPNRYDQHNGLTCIVGLGNRLHLGTGFLIPRFLYGLGVYSRPAQMELFGDKYGLPKQTVKRLFYGQFEEIRNAKANLVPQLLRKLAEDYSPKSIAQN